jgi:hypothetical protein
MSDEIKMDLGSGPDKSVTSVVVALSKDDCISLIAALNCATTFLKNDGPVKKWAMEFARGIRNLKREAFPEEG